MLDILHPGEHTRLKYVICIFFLITVFDENLNLPYKDMNPIKNTQYSFFDMITMINYVIILYKANYFSVAVAVINNNKLKLILRNQILSYLGLSFGKN